MKSVRSVSFDVGCCCGSCLTIFVFGTATVRVKVFVFLLINDLHITFALRNQSLISLVFFHTVTQNVAQTCDY